MKMKSGKKWAFKSSTYKRLSEDDVEVFNDGSEDVCAFEKSRKKVAKKIFVQASKRLKRATWSALKSVYRGFVYSSYQVAYTYGGVPGLDPQFLPCAVHVPYVPSDVLRYRNRY